MSKKVWLLIISLYLISRVYTLLDFPLFTDEVYYQRLATQAIKENNWFYSFWDGKEPFYFWILLIVNKILPIGIYSGRLISLVFGLLTLPVVYLLGGFVSVLFYLLSPFVLIYNQLGVLDGFLTFLLSLTLLLITKKKIVLAGFIMFLAILTKSLAIIYLPIFLILIGNLRKIFVFGFIALLGYCFIYLLPGHEAILSKNSTFMGDIGTNFFSSFKMVLKDWLIPYFGLGTLLLAIYGLNKKNIYLSLLIFAPIIALSLVAKIYFPRYLLFITIPMFILTAHGLSKVKNIWVKIIVFVLCVALSFKLPAIERWQFFEGWPSGYHIEQVFKSLDSGDKKLIYVPSYGVGEFLRWKYLPDTNYQIVTFGEEYPKIGKDALLVSNEIVPGLSLVKEFCHYECKSKVYLYESNN